MSWLPGQALRLKAAAAGAYAVPAASWLICGLLMGATADAQSSPLGPDQAMRTKDATPGMPHARQITFVSKLNGHRYLISMALPFTPAPPQGYKALYVLDGNVSFSAAAAIARYFVAPDAVVVGIGYPTDPAFARAVFARRGTPPASFKNMPADLTAWLLERSYDLTLPASNESLAAQRDPTDPPQRSANVGGLDDFLKIIEQEIKPRVARAVPIDSTQQALFGHSLGGLAALHALFVEPQAFRTFLIASPSIWYNGRAVLADEAAFAAAVSTGKVAPRILITVGGAESTPPALDSSIGVDRAVFDDFIRRGRMVENGRELVARLKNLHGPAGFVVHDYTVYTGQSHGTAGWMALAQGIAFAFADTP